MSEGRQSMTDLRGSDSPCDQGIHWIECEGCKMCGRSWDEAMEHAKQMSSMCNCDLLDYEHEVCEHPEKKEG